MAGLRRHRRVPRAGRRRGRRGAARVCDSSTTAALPPRGSSGRQRCRGAAGAVAIHAEASAAGHGRGVPGVDRAPDPRQPPDRALHRPARASPGTAAARATATCSCASASARTSGAACCGAPPAASRAARASTAARVARRSRSSSSSDRCSAGREPRARHRLPRRYACAGERGRAAGQEGRAALPHPVRAAGRDRPAAAGERSSRGRHRVTITVRPERGVTRRASLYAQRL